jgi:glycosyltransferase involved in cell wall biosynthesis
MAGGGVARGPHLLAGATVRHFGAATPPRGRLLAAGQRVAGFIAALAGARIGGPFDVLHAFWADDTALLAALAAVALRVPAVVSIGGGERVWLPDIGYGGAGTRRGRARVRLTLGLAGAVTAGSVAAVASLPRSLARRAEVVPLGIDPGRFRSRPAVTPPGPPWRLVHLASMNRVKDQATLLRAFSLVLQRLGGAASLDCAGEDTLDGEVQRLAAALGIADRVRFLGWVPPGRLPDLLAGAHLHVMSSRFESQGVALLEAAAAGVPTVGTAVGLLPSLAPQAGRAVPPGDAGALAAGIISLLTDDRARVALADTARRYAMEHDAAWTAASFERIYRRLVRV